jgi:hypothetical protein
MPCHKAWVSLAVFAIAGMPLLSGCTTVQVASDYDASVNFASYHTFTLMQREHRGIRNPLATVRAEDDIKQELQRRGYALASAR